MSDAPTGTEADSLADAKFVVQHSHFSERQIAGHRTGMVALRPLPRRRSNRPPRGSAVFAHMVRKCSGYATNEILGAETKRDANRPRCFPGRWTSRGGPITSPWQHLCPHREFLKRIRSERRSDRYVRGIPTARDQYAADAGCIVARVKRVPPTADKGLEPACEIHRRSAEAGTPISPRYPVQYRAGMFMQRQKATARWAKSRQTPGTIAVSLPCGQRLARACS